MKKLKCKDLEKLKIGTNIVLKIKMPSIRYKSTFYGIDKNVIYYIFGGFKYQGMIQDFDIYLVNDSIKCRKTFYV